jgi:copper chaperone CopZ
MKSVAGVESVDVNLEKGLAAVKMKPGNVATLKQLRGAITKNGFTMKESSATVAGKVVVENGKPRLQVSGSNDVLELTPESEGKPTAQSMQGKAVVVVGVIPEAPKGTTPDSIRYRSITEEIPK